MRRQRSCWSRGAVQMTLEVVDEKTGVSGFKLRQQNLNAGLGYVQPDAGWQGVVGD
jgi:hypothetical protein